MSDLPLFPEDTLLKLLLVVQELGIQATQKEPDNGEGFPATFKGRELVLYKGGSPFEQVYTLVHIVGHMMQWRTPHPDLVHANMLAYGPHQKLSSEDIQCIYTYEYEAARIGRRLLQDHVIVTPALDAMYTRFFFADFRYLIHFIETGLRGPSILEDFVRREPYTSSLISPATEPLRSLVNVTFPAEAHATVV